MPLQVPSIMKPYLPVVLLRVLAVTSSLSLLGGYVWFTQRKAQPSAPPAALVAGEVEAPTVEEVEAFINPTGTGAAGTAEPATVMLSSKNISQPVFSTRRVKEAVGTAVLSVGPETVRAQPSPYVTPGAPSPLWVLSGSKSFTGASTVVSGQLQTSAAPPAPPPPPPLPPTVMTSSKSGVVVLVTPSEVAAANGAKVIQVNTEPSMGTALPPLTAKPPPPAPKAPPAREHVVFSSSKIGPVLRQEFGVGPPSQTEGMEKNIGSWGFLPVLSWDLRDALRQMEFQMKKGLGVDDAPRPPLSLPPSPVVMPGSKSLRLLPLSPPSAAGGGAPALPDAAPAEPKPTTQP